MKNRSKEETMFLKDTTQRMVCPGTVWKFVGVCNCSEEQKY